MDIKHRWSSVIATIVVGLAVATGAHAADGPASDPSTRNAALVRDAFDAWRRGDGSVFDLLADDVVWTVSGTSPVSGTYRSRTQFMDEAVAPITARLATPIVPEVQSIVAQGHDVVVVWRGLATTRLGTPYENHYAWQLTFQRGRIVRVTAFLDTWALQRLMR